MNGNDCSDLNEYGWLQQVPQHQQQEVSIGHSSIEETPSEIPGSSQQQQQQSAIGEFVFLSGFSVKAKIQPQLGNDPFNPVPRAISTYKAKLNVTPRP